MKTKITTLAALTLAATLTLATAEARDGFFAARGDQSPLSGSAAGFAAADADKDGQITLQEFKDWRAANWSRLDRNGDGVFSADDLPMIVRSRWDGERARQRRAAVDSNGDGVISRDEALAAPPYAFLQADADGNGALTRDEITAARARRGN